MEENISIIDLIFSNFSLKVINGGFRLSMTWAFFFFFCFCFVCRKVIKYKFSKDK